MSVQLVTKTLTIYYGPFCCTKRTLALHTGVPCFSVQHWLNTLRDSSALTNAGTFLDNTIIFDAVRTFLKEHGTVEHIAFVGFPGNAEQLDWVMTELPEEWRIHFCYVHMDWKTAMQRNFAFRTSLQCEGGVNSTVQTSIKCYPGYNSAPDHQPDDTDEDLQSLWQSYFFRVREMYRRDRYGLFRSAVDVAHDSLLKKGLRMDLHLHTTASDGTDSPREMMDKVVALGIGLCAVTDHDTISGLVEAKERAQQLGIALLPGIEVSALWKGQVIHLLGYGIDPENVRLNSAAEYNRNARQEYDVRVLRKIESKGMLPLDTEDKYTVYDWNRHRGGWKLLNYLMDAGLCQDGYDYLDLIKELNVGNIWYLSVKDAIKAIHDSGQCVLAHPGAYGWRVKTLSIHIEELLKEGIDGLECRHPQNSPEMTDYLLEYCTRYGLLSTGGSDEHGNLSDRALGTPWADTRMLCSNPIIDKIIWADA